MGFAEDLAKATEEKKAAAEEYRVAEEMAAAWPAFDPLADYKRLMAEFNDDVQKAVSVLKENNVSHIIVVSSKSGSISFSDNYVRYNKRAWGPGNWLCLFEDGTWTIKGRFVKRAEKQVDYSPESHGSVLRAFNNWNDLGACGVAPGGWATSIATYDDAYPHPHPSDVKDLGDGKELTLDPSDIDPYAEANYRSLRGALIGYVARELAKK